MSEPLTMNPLQQAVVAIQRLRVRNAELEQAAAAPIAVVGMGCRLPAGGSSPAALWEALSSGRDGSMEVPADRWDVDAFYDPNLGTPGKMYVRKGCFIPDVDLFDPLFFRISPREAIGMDPQQRLLLEVTWEALEDAGLSATRLVGSQTGVFLGISTKDYATLLGRSAHGSDSNATAGAGTAASVASGRLSYVFGFHGPCFAVDTACSSSLVATHLAVQALRAKECGLAVVAGVNLMLTPDITVNFCQGRLLSPDGHCKTFDAAASGYARGEGCGVVVLKRLADAVADGDRVQAVIRGSAINQDGRSAGLTAPNGLAQEAVIRQALANAGLPPEAIDAIEAHGTGTALGDPIEMHALKGVFEDRVGPLHVGSIKANIGHAEAAAGISGLIKAVLMLQHQEVPPLLHFNQLNPHIDLGGMDVRIPTALVPAALSQVGVSSFGWSGTNAHVVLGAAPPPEPAKAASGEAQPPRLLISARTPEALRELIGRYREFFAVAPHSFADACHTAAVGRARHPWWVCVERSEQLDTAVPSRAPLPEIPVTTGRKIQLPKYPFERQRYWAEAAPAAPVEETNPAAHLLLGKRLVLPMSRETRWEARLSSRRPGLHFLAEHEVAGRAVLPAACFVEMALAASPDRALEDIEIVAPLPVAAETDRLVQTIADRDGSLQIVSSTAEATDATVHVRCRAVPLAPASPPSLDLPERDGTALDADALYAAMARRGVRHGPSFRLLDGITRGEGWARARLRDGQGGRFRLDPTRLDAALQLAAAALPNTDDETLVPVRVGRFALHHAPAEAAVVTVRASRDEAGASADILVTDAAGLAIEVRRLRFQAAQRDGTALHMLRWKDAPLVAHPGRAGFLPKAEELAQALEAEGRRLAVLHDMADYERAGQAMEALATQYAVATLRRLGMSFEAGGQFTVAALAGSLGVAERHGRLFRRLLGMLEEDGVLARTNRRMTVVHEPAAEDCDAALRALLLRFPAMAGEIGLLGRCGESLAEVLTGQTEPLGLLFPADGNEGGAGAFYEGSAYARTINGLLSAAAGQIAARLPPGRVLRVLEAGAGTGGATGAMLGAIPRDARHYVFTDVSRGFLAAAERKFAGEGLVSRLLDVEAPGEGQGFTPASFDLVLAANVLHATRDLRCSLGNLRELLAPGGLLLLVEGTEARRWTDIIFGLTEGWWRFEDADLRPHHPLLAAERWTALLGECGFEAAGMAGEVILARRPHEPAVEAEGWHLLGATAAGLPAALAAAGARVAGKEAQHWVCTLPPAPPEEAAQAGLLDDLVAVAREAMRQPEAPTLTILAEDGLGHAGVSGFVRTLALEAPQLRPRMLLGSSGLESLVDELLAMDREAEVRWTVEGRRQVLRLVPASAALPLCPPRSGALGSSPADAAGSAWRWRAGLPPMAPVRSSC
jgi:acyl transferase domain-containing protein/SAM-dependent methyltransferase